MATATMEIQATEAKENNFKHFFFSFHMFCFSLWECATQILFYIKRTFTIHFRYLFMNTIALRPAFKSESVVTHI